MLKRRLEKELHMLMEDHNLNLYLDYNLNGACLNIYLRDIDKTCLIKYPKDYPFRPCNIFIIQNNKEISYINYLKNKHSKILKYIKYPHKFPMACPCCFNMVCQWEVSHTSNKMVEEFIFKYNKLEQMENRIHGYMTLNKIFNENYLKALPNTILEILTYL